MLKTNKNFYWLAGLMTVLVLIVMVVSYYILWLTAIEEKRTDLVHIVQSQARLIEAIARFDMKHNRVEWETPIGERGPTSLLSMRAGADTFSQIYDAHKHYQGFGETGEILIAGIENSQIMFLLSHKKSLNKKTFTVPFDGENAEPMRRALSSLSGSMVGRDYEGEIVLAAYEPIDVLNLGLVAKVSLDEVKAPFIRAGFITSFVTVVLIFISSFFFRRLTKPIANKIIENEQKFRDLVENINEWIWEVDVSGTLLYSSPKVSQIIGYSYDEVVGHSLYEFMTSIDVENVQDVIEQSSKTKTSIHALECTFINNKQEIVEVEMSAEYILNSKGKLIGYRGVAHDISERKQREHLLKRYRDNLEEMVADRTIELEHVNKELRDFAYIVSHDLRSPLVSITGFTGELNEDMKILSNCASQFLGETAEDEYRDVKMALNETIPESLHYIETAADKMNRLINSILTLSRIGGRTLVYEKVDIKQLIVNNLQAMAFQIEQSNTVVDIAELPILEVDELAMEQIFGNLLGNAIKYLSPDRNGIINVWCEENKTQVFFYIQDNGIGIAEQDLSQIFKLFKRVGEQKMVGDGMGLAYVQTLIRRLGGKIECQSVLGEGATFSFSIPKR